MKKSIIALLLCCITTTGLLYLSSCNKKENTVFIQTTESIQGNWELSSFTSTCMSESTKITKKLTISNDEWSITTTCNQSTYSEFGYLVKDGNDLKLNLIFTLIQHDSNNIEIVCGTDGNTDCEEHYYFNKVK